MLIENTQTGSLPRAPYHASHIKLHTPEGEHKAKKEVEGANNECRTKDQNVNGWEMDNFIYTIA